MYAEGSQPPASTTGEPLTEINGIQIRSSHDHMPSTSRFSSLDLAQRLLGFSSLVLPEAPSLPCFKQTGANCLNTCASCGTSETSGCWRRGWPLGAGKSANLCNKCGLRYKSGKVIPGMPDHLVNSALAMLGKLNSSYVSKTSSQSKDSQCPSMEGVALLPSKDSDEGDTGVEVSVQMSGHPFASWSEPEATWEDHCKSRRQQARNGEMSCSPPTKEESEDTQLVSDSHVASLLLELTNGQSTTQPTHPGIPSPSAPPPPPPPLDLKWSVEPEMVAPKKRRSFRTPRVCAPTPPPSATTQRLSTSPTISDPPPPPEEPVKPTPVAVSYWDNQQVSDWLRAVSCADCVGPFREHGLDGAALRGLMRLALQSSKDVLEVLRTEMGITSIGTRLRLLEHLLCIT